MSLGQEISAPPSIVLALMALKLADMRVYGCPHGDFELQPRGWAVDDAGNTLGASGEYYAILDRIARGETP